MKILLVDDHALFRDGMHYVLRQLDAQADILDASNFPDALNTVKSHPDLDLALLDLYMPGNDGIASVKLFHSCYPDIPMVVISGSDQRTDIEQVMNSGAMGFIPKTATSKIMVQALRMVLDGGVYLPPLLLQQAVAHMEQKAENRRNWRTNESGLTARQTEVLQHLAMGLSNRDIAQTIGLAEGTVKVHIAAIFSILHVNKRIDAAHAAQRLGLLAENPTDS